MTSSAHETWRRRRTRPTKAAESLLCVLHTQRRQHPDRDHRESEAEAERADHCEAERGALEFQTDEQDG
jgi:hypothetical protein